MFTKSAEWYDLIYSFKDYAKEAEAVTRLLHDLHPSAKTLLDVACGTGEHARFLAQQYHVDGIDLNETLVAIAQKKNPLGAVSCADMTNFALAQKYDVILCLFSSIGYVRTIENVVKTLTCFKRHLNEGGSVVVEPWFEPEAWKPGRVNVLTAERDNCKIVRMSLSEQDETMAILTCHYLVGRLDSIHHEVERHELGLFSRQQMLDAFQSAGLNAEHRQPGLCGRGIYIARI